MIGEKLTAEILYALCSVYEGEANMIELVHYSNKSLCYMTIDDAMASGFKRILELVDEMDCGWVELTRKFVNEYTKDDPDTIVFEIDVEDSNILNMFTCYEIYTVK